MNEAVNQILEASQEAPPPEIPADKPTQASPIKDERLTGKLDLLLKREGFLVERDKDIKRRESDLQAKVQELEAKLARVNEFESAKGNSKKALELLGLDYNQLTESILKDGEIPPSVEIQKLRDEFYEHRKAQEESSRLNQEREAQDAKQKEEAALAKRDQEFREEIVSLLKKDPERYQYTLFEQQEDLVYELIDEHYRRTLDEATGKGEIMLTEKAADLVEKHLEDKYNKAKDLSKTKALWGNVPKEAQQKIVEQHKRQIGQPPKTLTNQLSATPSQPKPKVITDEERVQKAIAYAKGLRP